MFRNFFILTVLLASVTSFAENAVFSYATANQEKLEQIDDTLFCSTDGDCVIAIFKVDADKIEMKLLGTKQAGLNLASHDLDVEVVPDEEFVSMYNEIPRSQRFSFELEESYDKATTDTSLGMRAPSRHNDRYRTESRAAIERNSERLCRVAVGAAVGIASARAGGSAMVGGVVGGAAALSDGICGRRNCP